MFRQIGPMEIFIILGVVLLLFGGRKLPELARGSGRALRIFKSEVQELHGDDDELTAESDDSEAATTAQKRDPRPEQG